MRAVLKTPGLQASGAVHQVVSEREQLSLKVQVFFLIACGDFCTDDY